jgi:hypothetical protein
VHCHLNSDTSSIIITITSYKLPPPPLCFSDNRLGTFLQIAISSMATGDKGFPPDRAAHVTMRTIKSFLSSCGSLVDRIILVSAVPFLHTLPHQHSHSRRHFQHTFTG